MSDERQMSPRDERGDAADDVTSPEYRQRRDAARGFAPPFMMRLMQPVLMRLRHVDTLILIPF